MSVFPIISNAQYANDQLFVEDNLDSNEAQDHVFIYPTEPSPELVMEMHDQDIEANSPVLVQEVAKHLNVKTFSSQKPEENVEIVISLDELPGVTALDPEMEQKLEVVDEEPKTEDENEAKKSSKPAKWDWESKGAQGFIAWIKERINDVPKHSGYDTAGIERAVSYLDRLDNEISKAMRLDLDGELDADKVEEVRANIYDGIERLNARHEKVNKKSKKKKKKSASQEHGLVKEGQKIPGISGIVITVPLLISTIVRTCINGNVSAGHDIEDSFKKLSTKFDLTDREQAECMQLFADLGYPAHFNRGYLLDEDVDSTSSDNFDYSASYQS
jgi:hypothetical protein